MNAMVPLVLALCVGCATAGHVIELTNLGETRENGYTQGTAYGLQDTNIYYNNGAFTMEFVPFTKDQVTDILVRVAYRKQQGNSYTLQLVKMNWPRSGPSMTLAKESIQPKLENTYKKLSVKYYQERTYIRKEYTWISNQIMEGYTTQPGKTFNIIN